MKYLKLTLIILALSSLATLGQVQRARPSWDLTYKSILDQNSVNDNELIRLWLKSISPAESWLTELNGSPVTSAVLIEYPAFHAAERTTILLHQVENEAFYWDFVEGGKWGRNEEPVKLQAYDALLKEVAAWQQLKPKSKAELPEGVWPGYMGFLSYFDGQRSTQMLLTMDDFAGCTKAGCSPGEANVGRLLKALYPILIEEGERNYKHRPEAEIASMTPEERLNEYIKERDYHTFRLDDTHSSIIRKYILRDGTQTFPHLIQLMENYNPRRHRDTSSTKAVFIANDIDENVVRLRASAEGRRVIEAVEKLEARMHSERGMKTGNELYLKMIRRTNSKDEAIGDALRLNYGIKFAEGELLEFVNYLVRVVPEYPSWSGTVWKMNLKRKNEAGYYPAQGPVVKYPKRYYQQLIKFRRLVSSGSNQPGKT